MFLDYFKLKEQPFGVTPDPRFLYLGYGHREALASLYYGIESDRAFVALIAQPGLGKTTLTFQLLEHLQETSRTVFLFQTQCNSREFFQYLLNGLGVDAAGMDLVSMHNKLNGILARELLAGRRFILAVDEAQNLAPEVLETIRLLSNFETPREKLMQILLIGQPQLAEKLARPELEQLYQRVSVFAKIEPFGAEDTARYIAHRLEVAGYEGSPLFSPGALRIIAEHSQGIPRKINALCFSALSLACAMGRKMVDVTMMEEVIADRDVESIRRPGVAPAVVSAPEPVPAPAPVPVPAPVAVRAPLQDPSTVMLRSALSPYFQEKPERGLVRWVLGIAGIAACILMGIAILSMSPNRIDGLLQGSSEAWGSVRNVAASIEGYVGVKSDSVGDSSSLDVQAAELPGAGSVKPSSPGDDTETEIEIVIVRPGETLRQVMLRTVGEYSGETIAQIRKLNPAVADFGHLRAGQVLRFPRVVSPTSAGNEGTSADAKN